MAATRTRNQGKTPFIKEYLNDHPQANPRAVNEAWKEAGMVGTISDSLINKQRSAMSLTGNIRGKKKSRSRGVATVPSNATGARRGRPTGRVTRVNEIEADLDRLLYRVMDLGELTDVEDALRLARRRLYAASTR